MATRKKPAAKRGASRYKAPSKRPVPGWIWLACGLVVGVFIMLLVNLQPGSDAIKRDKAQPERAGTAPKPTPSATSQEPGKPKYDFYTLLPESEVIVPPDAVPPPAPPAQPTVTPEEAAKIDAARAQAALNGETPPPPPPVAPAAQAPLTTQFFLQAGSFRRKDDAESVRAQIILLGQSVRVESGTVRDETWHRVLVGPFTNREQLAQSQKALAANGFSNLLLQQRQSR
ncbi:SPOR domain-containing protein [Phytopseudomonas dryadis]|uniref:Cell division protein n=1 Tax=Phytopseudomonas dryadis TaxID=2487520 RepID=A0A4Q9R8R8_9GAMM|nr:MULTISPECIES: SPOR domain-containing protein [Pseudomonas]TBU97027.1 cell division protein [Pseudomonas dryadis]TBV08634.1 cell division protein [Pseudomonas dryadis]TBV13930.1 cell division protein [Pseudomonas sp. FRB 230]